MSINISLSNESIKIEEMSKLKNSHLEVYNVISEFIENNKISPTLEEIGQVIGMGKGTVAFILSVLKEKGLITYEKGKARTIQLTDKAKEFPPRITSKAEELNEAAHLLSIGKITQEEYTAMRKKILGI